MIKNRSASLAVIVFVYVLALNYIVLKIVISQQFRGHIVIYSRFMTADTMNRNTSLQNIFKQSFQKVVC